MAFCICTGRRYERSLTASGEEAVAWLTDFEARTQGDRQGVRELVDKLGANKATPAARLTLTLTSHGGHGEVVARLGDRELVLSNARGEPAGQGSWHRPATPAGTFTLAARWLLGFERPGCAAPEQDAFWLHRAQLAAYVASAPARSLESLLEALPPWFALFFRVEEGTEERAQPSRIAAGLRQWSARHPESRLGMGWFTGTDSQATCQLAAAIEGASTDGGHG